MNPIDYLNNSVWCKVGTSKIHGVGVFAIRDIKKGTRLSDYFLKDIYEGKKMMCYAIPIKELSKLHKEILSLILDRIIINSDQDVVYCISPNGDQILQSFMNHSEDANSDGEFALRDIKKGEEVTENFKKLVDQMHYASQDHMKFLWK